MIMARHIVYMVMERQVNPTRYYLKINYEYGIRVKQTRSVERVFSERLYKEVLHDMYRELSISNKGAIKLAMNVSHFSEQNRKTLSLLNLEEDRNAKHLSQKIHSLRESFGLDIIKTADEL